VAVDAVRVMALYCILVKIIQLQLTFYSETCEIRIPLDKPKASLCQRCLSFRVQIALRKAAMTNNCVLILQVDPILQGCI
jgi:hypothetical protein